MDKKQREEAERILNEKLGNIEKEKENKQQVKQEKVAEGKIKIGDTEYDIKQLEQELKRYNEIKEIEKKHGNLISLYADYTRKAQRLKELERKIQESSNFSYQNQQQNIYKNKEAIEEEIKNLDEEAQRIREQARKYGLVLNDDLKNTLLEIENLKKELLQSKKELEEIKSERVNEIKEDLELDLQETISKYPFINRNDLIDYMIEEAKKGRIISVEEAAKERYKDEIIEYEIKKRSGRVPTTEATTSGGELQANKPQTYSFTDDQQKIFQEGLEVFENALRKIK
ncbi:MAG: hypothetical protein QXX45_03285 [Candidatus Aenigmatarchaeota archaeon]